MNCDLSPEQKEEIRRSWDILFGYMPELRNTLEHAGSFSRRRAALVSSEKSAGSPSFPICEKTPLPTKKKTDKKKKHQFQSSRISCYSCNAPATVSATSMRMRKTNRVCCVKCYPLLKKLEECKRQIVLIKLKYKRLRNIQNSTKKKLNRSYQKTGL